MAQAPSAKQLMINKANGRMVAITSIASFVVVFCLVASFTLIGQLNYQNKVIGKKKAAYNQLRTDLKNINSLIASYNAFSDTSQNILGANPDGTGPNEGDNGKIVLDSLPSKYDFPALATSLEKLLSDQGVQIQSITGTDDEVAQAAGTSSAPTPVEMPFEITVEGDYTSIKNVILAFQRSIRPIKVTSMEVSASGDNSNTLTIDATTYYQPEKSLSIRQEVVK
jgi:Tfp pilus assembly protein PilO